MKRRTAIQAVAVGTVGILSGCSQNNSESQPQNVSTNTATTPTQTTAETNTQVDQTPESSQLTTNEETTRRTSMSRTTADMTSDQTKTENEPLYEAFAGDPRLKNTERIDTVALGNESWSNKSANKQQIVFVWYRGETSRNIGVTVNSENRSNPLLNDHYQFNSNSSLKIRLLEPDQYSIKFRLSQERPENVEIPSLFDCNTHISYIGISESGNIQTARESTMEGCGSTTVQ